MGAFKPMVKMETTEPSVILKLKRGGHVNAKEERKEEHGHKPMHDERYAMGGTAPSKPSAAERRRAMNPNFRKGGEAAIKEELKAHERKPAHLGHEGLKRGGKVHKAEGGSITGSMTKTTVKGDAKRFVSDMQTMDRSTGKGGGKTGDVKLGNAGYKDGGSIHTAEHMDRASGPTKGVKLGAAGYKRGGKVRKAEGGDCRFTDDNINDGEHPDHGSGKTGDVRLGNAGGYRKGGEVQDDGKAEKMPRHFVSKPVANSLQSGTFKRGGHAKR